MTKYKYVTLENGKRHRMTEAGIRWCANPPEWILGGTISIGLYYEIMAAREYVKIHPEIMDIAA